MAKIKQLMKLLIPAKYWKTRRKIHILANHKKVADFWNPIIEAYYDGKIEKYELKPKKQLSTQKVIWQYWGQGISEKDLPEIIRICFESVDKNKGDYLVIRLTDENIFEYIDLPDFVWEKRKDSQFNRTFFSDLLRLLLLSTYGGVWLDATILLTGCFPEMYEKQEFFMFQRSDEEKNKEYWESVYAYYFGWESDFKVRMLSSVIFSQKDSIVITTLRDLLLYYWKTQNKLSDYFCFQILFNELMTKFIPEKNCTIINDCIPHILQTKINGSYDNVSFEETLRLTNIHKMAYFSTTSIARLKSVLGLEN